MYENILASLNSNDVLDVQTFLEFLEKQEILYIKDGSYSSIANALEKWADLIDEYESED